MISKKRTLGCWRKCKWLSNPGSQKKVGGVEQNQKIKDSFCMMPRPGKPDELSLAYGYLVIKLTRFGGVSCALSVVQALSPLQAMLNLRTRTGSCFAHSSRC